MSRDYASRSANGAEQDQASGDGPLPAPHRLVGSLAAKAFAGGGRPLDAAERGHFEPRFSRDLSHVRVHADHAAGASALALGARAFTYGGNIAFAPGQLAPASRNGQALLTHELTHAVQQGARPAPQPSRLETTTPGDPSEREADRAARSPGGPIAVGQATSPRIACGPFDDHDEIRKAAQDVRQAIRDQSVQEILDKIGNPTRFRADLLARIPGIKAECSRVVAALSQKILEAIAGSPAGVEVLQAILAQLDAKSPEAARVTQALDVRSNSRTSAPITKMTPEILKGLAQINRAVSLDPHKVAYTQAPTPLKLPVDVYSAGRAMDGGVYYDPDMQTDAGLTVSPAIPGRLGRQRPLTYIKLGPEALARGDGYTQSTLWHEFQHYSMYMSFGQEPKAKSAKTRALESESESVAEGQPSPNAETDATCVQIADYLAVMSDEAMTTSLLYLAKNLGSASVDFRDAGIARIVDAAGAAGPQAKPRVVKLIDGIRSPVTKNTLRPLRDALLGRKKP